MCANVHKGEKKCRIEEKDEVYTPETDHSETSLRGSDPAGSVTQLIPEPAQGTLGYQEDGGLILIHQ